MRQSSAAQTPEEYLARVDATRREDVQRLHALIRSTLPDLAPFLHFGMLGYGRVHYRYASGREGDTFRVGLAANRSSLSLYAFAADARGYVAERYRERLPRASVGRSCVRFKRLADVDLDVLVDLLRETARVGTPAIEVPPAAESRPASRRTPARRPGVSTGASTAPARQPARRPKRPAR